MVKVTVSCLPEVTQEALKALFSDIFNILKKHTTITWVEEEKDELIHFPPDKMVYGLGQEILAEVEGLPAGAELRFATRYIDKTESQRRIFGEDIVRVIKGHF